MIDKYTLATNAQGTRVFIPKDGGPLIFREYTLAEARQVADWLNGHDQPLPAINVADYPGGPHLESLAVMRPPSTVRITDD